MSISAKINKDAIVSEDQVSAQFIPAAIDGNGSIKIDEFNSYTSESEGNKINALRGYPLKGVEIELPHDYTGIVLRENEKLKKDDDNRELKFSGKFNKFLYWNYDKNPSVNDSYQKALNWLKVADSLHSEVDSIDD